MAAYNPVSGRYEPLVRGRIYHVATRALGEDGAGPLGHEVARGDWTYARSRFLGRDAAHRPLWDHCFCRGEEALWLPETGYRLRITTVPWALVGGR